MNQNHPFYSTNTNLYDEFFRSSAPATLNGENVILSQEQQRRVYDTLNTSIVGNLFDAAGRQVMCAQKQYFPGGVLFTFPPIIPQHLSQGVCLCSPLSIPQKLPEFMPFHQPSAAVNTFFPSSVEYQQSPRRDSFQLKFHHDCSTSCTDLLNNFTQVPASRGYPDLSNIAGILEQTRVSSKICQTAPGISFPSPQIEFSSNARKLTLSKIVPPLCGDVVDILDENKDLDSKKKVSFSDDKIASTGDKSSQITSECICHAKKCKSTSGTIKNQKSDKQKKKKQNPQSATSSETTLSSASDDGNEEEGNKKPKKKRWWDRRKKTDSESTDSEADRPENDKKKNRNGAEDFSENDSEMATSSNHPDSESEDD